MASQHRKPRWTGSVAPGIRTTPALATAALTSVALFSQPAEAASGDGRPSVEDIEKKLDAFYSQTGTKKDTAAKEKETKRAKTFLGTATRYGTPSAPLPPPRPTHPPSIGGQDFSAPTEAFPEPAAASSEPAQAESYARTEAPARAGVPVQIDEPAHAEAEHTEELLEEPSAQLLADPEDDLKTAKMTVQGKLSKAQALLSFRTAGMPKAATQRQNTDSVTVTSETTAKAELALAFARAQLGKPVVLGASGPGSYDSPGLTRAAWASAGVSLPRTTFAQVTAGTPIRLPDARPGDLVFFHDDITHVGLYIGENRMIHAPHPGALIREDPIDFAGKGEIHSVVRPS